MKSGVTFTGSHIHWIDYNRNQFANFLNNINTTSTMVEGSGHLFYNIYNQFGEAVQPKAQGGTWGNQTLPNGTVVDFNDDHKLTEGDFFFESFCFESFCLFGYFHFQRRRRRKKRLTKKKKKVAGL